MSIIRSFLRNAQIVLCQEAHVTLARERDWKWHYREVAELFSSRLLDISRQTTTAGIAVFIKKEFVEGFRCVNLIQVIHGYACVLQLQGDLGALQIFAIYGDPNFEQERIRLWGLLLHEQGLWSQDQALTIMAGDSNMTLLPQDRLSRGAESGQGSPLERALFYS